MELDSIRQYQPRQAPRNYLGHGRAYRGRGTHNSQWGGRAQIWNSAETVNKRNQYIHEGQCWHCGLQDHLAMDSLCPCLREKNQYQQPRINNVEDLPVVPVNMEVEEPNKQDNIAALLHYACASLSENSITEIVNIGSTLF